jgi:hypothetical protein
MADPTEQVADPETWCIGLHEFFQILRDMMPCDPDMGIFQVKSMTASLIVFSLWLAFVGFELLCARAFVCFARVFSGFGRPDKMSSSPDDENSLLLECCGSF